MHVHPAQTPSHEAPQLDQPAGLSITGNRHGLEPVEEGENFLPLAKGAAGQLADHEGMDHHLRILEQGGEPGLRRGEVPDPHRRVDQDHRGRRTGDRRRGPAEAPESEDPSAASRREAARVIRASSPARTREVFSRMPVTRVASASSSSSMLSVVLICIYMPHFCRYDKVAAARTGWVPK